MKRQSDAAHALARAIRKATVQLIPFLCLAYTINFLDRVNVGFAALHMNDALGFSPSVYGFGAGIFFLGYIVFEIPSNLALRQFGARIWIARIMISWGLVACAMALVHSETSFYVTRALLGIAEAGFFPGIILYLTFWFPAAERARIVALFMASVPLATVFGGPLSGALLQMHGFLGFAGWQWLFVIEGIPAIVLGVLALVVLTDSPGQAHWLTDEEKSALSNTLEREAKATEAFGYANLRNALTRPRVLALGGLYFLMVTGLYGIGFWMPQVIGGFGLGSLSVGFLTAIPYLFAAIAMVLWGRHSDRVGERRWHIALPLFLAAASFAWSAYSGPLVPDHGGSDAGHARLLCCVRPVLVAAHRTPDRRRRGGRDRARQLTRQRGRIRRALHRRPPEGSDGQLLRSAPVPCSRTRPWRRHGTHVPGAAIRGSRSQALVRRGA